MVWTNAAGLQLRFRLHDPEALIVWPAAQPPGPADDLWQHTCCEVFVATAGATSYREFNLSPDGRWAAYDFAAYRRRQMAWVPPDLPRSHFDRKGNALCATLPPALLPSGPLAISLCCVIETRADGAGHGGQQTHKTYWALRHAAEQPDFHRRDSFTLYLDPSASS